MTDTTENQIMRGLAYTALESTWGAEWIRLESTDQRKVAEDFIGANISAREYQDRIWRGNLQSYADTLN